LIVNKKVPVKPLVSLSLKENFVQKGAILFEPKFIEISGPKDSIDNIDTIYTNRIQLENIDKNIKQNIALKTHKRIKYEYKRINISINVEQATQGEIEVPISIQSVSNKTIKLIPNKINIKYKVGLSEYHNINVGDFKLIIQYNDSLQEQLVLPVYLKKKPLSVFDVRYSPRFVEFIISDKE
jgi:YbbR domain-containing protein